MRRLSGFSLMEMMTTLLIISIIAAASAPMINKKMTTTTSTPKCFWTSLSDGKSIGFNLSNDNNSTVVIGKNNNGSKIFDRTNKPKPKLQILSTNADHIELEEANSSSIKIFLKNHTVGLTGSYNYTNDGPPQFAVAIGDGAKSVENYAVAIGASSEANNEKSIAIGTSSNTAGKGAIAIGAHSSASTSETIALGANATAISVGGIAIGSEAYTNMGLALGEGAKCEGEDSIAIGEDAYVENSNIIAIGTSATSDKPYSIAIGYEAKAPKTTQNSAEYATIALGYKANAINDEAIAIGTGAKANGESAIAIGSRAFSEIIGKDSEGNATFDNEGTHATLADGNGSIAIGDGPVAKNYRSVAIGASAYATAEHSIAIGTEAKSVGKNSVAIGAGAEATAEDQIVLGTPDSTVYIPGKLIVGGTTVLGINDDANVYLNVSDEDGGNGIVKLASKDDNVRTWDHLQKTDSGKGVSYDTANTWTSDRRLKNVGKAFTGGLAELKKLDLFHYTYKKDESKTPHVGVMAQDLQKVFPDAVTKGADGFLRIRLEDMFYALINSVKELDQKFDLLAQKQKKIDELEAKLDKLEKRLEKLEKQK